MDSCKLNGAEIDNHIIRVDAAGLGKSKLGDSQTSQQHDQSRAVFLGNVKFNEQEDNIRKHFEKCGYILDVRLVRDTSTGIGKGFGYVNFDSGDSVEKVSFIFKNILLFLLQFQAKKHLIVLIEFKIITNRLYA